MKLLNVIYSMYLNVRSKVAVNGLESEYFSNVQGLVQGDVLSPIFFSLYMNDFEMNFLRSGCIPVECIDLNLFM